MALNVTNGEAFGPPAPEASSSTAPALRSKRELLAGGLERAGMRPMVGHGGFFVMADTSVKLKYEDFQGGPFQAGHNPDFKFNAFCSTADPYERADDQSLRFKWLQKEDVVQCGSRR